jgi:hypothetical protein
MLKSSDHKLFVELENSHIFDGGQLADAKKLYLVINAQGYDENAYPRLVDGPRAQPRVLTGTALQRRQYGAQSIIGFFP